MNMDEGLPVRTADRNDDETSEWTAEPRSQTGTESEAFQSQFAPMATPKTVAKSTFINGVFHSSPEQGRQSSKVGKQQAQQQAQHHHYGYDGYNDDYGHDDANYDDQCYGNGSGNAEYNNKNNAYDADAYTEQPQTLKFLSNGTRTLNISNLDRSTTHSDITAIITGGQLLEIFLRPHDRIAQVSFVYPREAEDFMNYAKRNDTYIRDKRVRVSWPERHFVLKAHVANKIERQGASRNLVVRKATSRHTENSIREDLEHIHNLVVIAVKFEGESAFIETNSVANAIFAQNCMMSRAKYKGFRIEFGVDECNVPTPVKPVLVPSQVNTRQPKVEVPVNRFSVLDIGGNESGTETEQENGPMQGVAKRKGKGAKV